MKYKIFFLLLLVALSCSFEDEMEKASNECEVKVRQVFTEFEEKFGYICLTQDEILEYIEEQKIYEDGEIEVARPTIELQPYMAAEKSKSYGVYDHALRQCKNIKYY